MFHHRLTRSIPTILSHIPKASHRLPITHHLITSHIQRRISARFFSSDDSSSSSKKPTTPPQPKIEEKEKDKDKEPTPTTSKDATSTSTTAASEKDATENKTENKTDEKTEMKQEKTDASIIIDGEMSSDVNAVMAQIVLTQRANKANDVDKPRAPTPPELPLIPVHERPLFPGHQYTLWVNDPILMEQITRLYNLNRPYFAVHYRQDKGDTVHLKPTTSTTTTTTTTTPETTTPEEHSELVPPTPATNVKSPAQIAKEQQDEALMAEAKAREQRKRKKDKKLLANKYKDEIRTVPITSLKQLYPMGVMVHISRIAQTPHGINLTVFAHRRIRITELIETSPITRVSVIHIDEDPSQSAMPQSLRIISSSETPTPEEQRTRAELERIISLRRAYRQNIFMSIRELVNRKHIYVESLAAMFSVIEWDNLGKIADSVTTLMSGLADPHKQQAILSEMDILKRIDKAYEIIQRELKILELQEKIHKEVESKVQDQNKKHILMQQLQAIKKELGQNKDKALVGKFKARLKGKDVPEPIMRVIKDEMTKLKTLSPQASEFNVVRNYLDWLTILPWGVYTPENYDLKHAEQILDEDHYGLQDVKERILEFIAVGKLKGKVEQGKILTLVGPPGVGKTSIGKSIARALNRKFFRFSVGGTDDVAEVKGHRRTYVGALPGKIITCMKQTECMNPVILIDEIDKMGRSHHGDPSSALLEVLDPAQNGSFVDHFMDVPIDLSKVLFICTANVRDRIPGPLADRMDFITISGYVWKEQLQIVKKYLEPLERKRTGITESQATIDDSAYKSLIRWYCREAGVRNLQKHVERIYRKIALRIARDDHTVVQVNENNLSEFVGKPRFISDRMYDITPPGVVMGLAWNSMGGATLYIESAVADHLHIPQSPKREKKEKKPEDEKEKKLPEDETPVTTTAVIPRKKGVSGGLFCTGQMGDVMRESTQIAYTVAKAQLARIKPSSSFFRRHRIHMHVPHGAIPKDGPSAGITMVTSLLSLALHRSVRPDVAMTGELTLTGRVLPIGGVKEKVIAARRSNAPILIFPMENRKDWDELADYIKDGITVHFVNHYEQVFDIAFNGAPSTTTSKSTTTTTAVVTDATPPASLLDY